MLNWSMADVCPLLNKALIDDDVCDVVIDDHDDIDLVYCDSPDARTLRSYFTHHTGVIAGNLQHLTLDELIALTDISRENYVFFAMGDPKCFQPLTQSLVNEIRDGTIGVVMRIDVHYESSNDLSLLSLLLDDGTDQWTGKHLFNGHTLVNMYQDATHTMTIRGSLGSIVIPNYRDMNELELNVSGESLSAMTDPMINPYRYLVDDVTRSLSYLNVETSVMTHKDMIRFKRLTETLQRPGIIVIGLTGGIACGKSTVSTYLREKGYIIVDADVLTHQSYDDETIKAMIKEQFDCVDQGIIDRRKLGRIVFNNQEARRALERIIHPYVLKETIQAIVECQKKVIILDVPLLYEAHFDALCDKTIMVTCDEETQLSRLMARNGFSAEDAQMRIKAQMSNEEKCARADYIIDNSQHLEQLYKNIDEVMEVITR